MTRAIQLLLIALVIVRVSSVTWSATTRTRGDFYASMPGAYVETVNPTLWNSPDMVESWGYHNRTYFHGPIQYLTLYPLAYFDSFAAIASVLLPLYLLVLIASSGYCGESRGGWARARPRSCPCWPVRSCSSRCSRRTCSASSKSS